MGRASWGKSLHFDKPDTLRPAQEYRRNDRRVCKVRLIKWLLGRAVFKTAALAKGGQLKVAKCKCRGDRCKPARKPRVGEELEIPSRVLERRRPWWSILSGSAPVAPLSATAVRGKR